MFIFSYSSVLRIDSDLLLASAGDDSAPFLFG